MLVQLFVPCRRSWRGAACSGRRYAPSRQCAGRPVRGGQRGRCRALGLCGGPAARVVRTSRSAGALPRWRRAWTAWRMRLRLRLSASAPASSRTRAPHAGTFATPSCTHSPTSSVAIPRRLAHRPQLDQLRSQSSHSRRQGSRAEASSAAGVAGEGGSAQAGFLSLSLASTSGRGCPGPATRELQATELLLLGLLATDNANTRQLLGAMADGAIADAGGGEERTGSGVTLMCNA